MKKKVDFLPFKVGTVFNPINLENIKLRPKFKSVEIKYPSRLNAMALDPSKITSNENLKYSPGEIIIKIQINKRVKVSINNNSSSINICILLIIKLEKIVVYYFKQYMRH